MGARRIVSFGQEGPLKVTGSHIYVYSPIDEVMYSAFQIVPWGFREVLLSIKRRYNNPPVFITENGYGTEPHLLNDIARVDYHRVNRKSHSNL